MGEWTVEGDELIVRRGFDPSYPDYVEVEECITAEHAARLLASTEEGRQAMRAALVEERREDS